MPSKQFIKRLLSSASRGRKSQAQDFTVGVAPMLQSRVNSQPQQIRCVNSRPEMEGVGPWGLRWGHLGRCSWKSWSPRPLETPWRCSCGLPLCLEASWETMQKAQPFKAMCIPLRICPHLPSWHQTNIRGHVLTQPSCGSTGRAKGWRWLSPGGKNDGAGSWGSWHREGA